MPDAFDSLLGGSRDFRAVIEQARLIAPRNIPVLLLGETGTGKELIAKAIHQHSSQANGPWSPLNCSAFPPGLMESEFFGFERGAFTGAIQSRQGKLSAVDGGTL